MLRLFFLAILISYLSLWLTIFYWPALTGQTAFYQTDLAYFFEPVCNFLADSFKQAKIPYWNDLVFCGVSQIALLSPNIFYPFHFLFTFLPFSQSLAYILFFHQLIAGIGSFLFIKKQSWGYAAAIFAGISTAFCGYLFSMQNNYTLVLSASWIPLNLFLIDKIQTLRARSYYGVLFSFTVALMILGGRPEIFLPALIIIFAYIFISKIINEKNQFEKRKENPLRKLIAQVCFVLLGILLAMPSLLPAWEWSCISRRASGLPLDEIFSWSANWYDFIAVILSNPFGDISSIESPFIPLIASKAGAYPYLTSAYLGPITIILASWGFLDKNWSYRLLFIFLFFLSLCLCLGNALPFLSSIVQLIPALSVLRYPVKLMIFPLLFLILAASRGIYLVAQKRIGQITLYASMVLSFLFMLLALAILNNVLVLFSKESFACLVNEQMQNLVNNLFARELLVTSLMAFIFCICVVLYQKSKIEKVIFLTLVPVSTSILLIQSAFGIAHHFEKSNYYSTHSQLAEIIKIFQRKENANLQFKSDFIPYRFLSLTFDDVMPGRDYFFAHNMSASAIINLYNRDLLMPNTNMDQSIPSSFGYETTVRGNYYKYFVDVRKTCDLLREKNLDPNNMDYSVLEWFSNISATRYIAWQINKLNNQGFAEKQWPLLPPAKFKLIHQMPNLNINLYEINNSLPRAYLSFNWNYYDSSKKLLQEYLKAKNNDFNPALITYLDKASKQDLGEYSQGLSKNFRQNFCQVFPEKYAAESMDFRINMPASGLLVLADTFYPGWSAYVDEKPVKILQANLFNRAIFLTQGQHIVKFEYRPQSLYLGLFCFLFSMTLLFIISLNIYISKKQELH